MRIWSISPKYLDTKGLVALWRETLLARKVLENKTIGYRNHPQLIRFRERENPINAINFYLKVLYDEAVSRNFHFDKNKTDLYNNNYKIPVTRGQINYEFTHLKNKLISRDHDRFLTISKIRDPDPHPIFVIKEGDIEIWEIVAGKSY